VSSRNEGKWVHVTVSDTGPGLKKEDIERIFQQFQQVGPVRRGGSGLGLTISKKFVEMHGGKIWVESEVGKGSEFKFFLPFEKEYKILVIDDDESFRAFCGGLLRKSGYRVLEARTGTDGINVLYESQPDLIILDLKLPDISGYEVIGRIHSDKDVARTAIVVVSGYMEQLEKLEALYDKFTIPRLVKPFDGQELLGIIQKLLIGKRMQ
jgi:CheY-like chemotaxis protein